MATINVSSNAALSTALKAAKAGDTILLSGGSYALTASNLKFTTADVTIASADPGRPAVLTRLEIVDSAGITVRDLDLNALPSGGNNPFKIYRSQDIHLENLDIHGTEDNNPAQDVSGLLIRESRDVSVKGSEFHDLADAIAHIDSQNVTISGNEFHHLKYDGVRGGGTSDLTISGNLFRDFFPAAGDHPDAIQLWTTNTTASARNIVISDNAFIRGDGTAVQGIFIRDQVGTLPYQNVVITGNVIAGGMYHGISISHADNVVIDDNIVQGFPEMKSWIRLNKVDGATVTDNSANEVIILESTAVVNVNNKVLATATDAGAWAFGQWNGGAGGAGGGGAPGGAAVGLQLFGDAGANTLIGGAGGDTIDGGGGVDLLTGSGGNDVYVVSAGDKVVEASGGGSDLIRSDEMVILPANVERLELTGTKSVPAHGNDLDNQVIGNAGGNLMRGYAGADTLDGRGGNDMLQGDAGNDRLIGGAGADTFVFKVGGGADTVADFSAGDILDVSAILGMGGRGSLAAGAGGVTISFTTGESITLTGATLDHLVSTTTGWVFG